MILLRLISWPYARRHLLRCLLTMAGIVLGLILLGVGAVRSEYSQGAFMGGGAMLLVGFRCFREESIEPADDTRKIIRLLCVIVECRDKLDRNPSACAEHYSQDERRRDRSHLASRVVPVTS